MARRSSARLRGLNPSTPQRVSLSHDAAPHTVPARLATLQEDAEIPGAFPRSNSPRPSLSRKANLITSKADDAIATPTKNTQIKPSCKEMHPQLHQQSTAKPLDEARHLGFTSMLPHTEPRKRSSQSTTFQATPTKIREGLENAKSPSFQFTFRREQSLELSPAAKALMHEKREEAARIREQMIANGEYLPTIDESVARKIATPKAKGRFTQAHAQQFEKMDSIAGHASAFRADPNRAKPLTPSSKTPTDIRVLPPSASIQKSLKRSVARAELDAPEPVSVKVTPHKASGATTPLRGNHLARLSSVHTKRPAEQANSPSPSKAKRVKIDDAGDVSLTRPSSNAITNLSQPLYPKLPELEPLEKTSGLTPIDGESLLSRSAQKLKSGLGLAQTTSEPINPLKPLPMPKLLARSPLKPAAAAAAPVSGPSDDTQSSKVPLLNPFLARSPSKAGSVKAFDSPKVSSTSERQEVKPLLSRSPLKGPVAKVSGADEVSAVAPSTPLLSRSPTRLPIPDHLDKSPSQDNSTNLLGRFNLLRATPMKSILRTPQRLYSDDPAKIAAGTHLATPPNKTAGRNIEQTPGPSALASTKRVDFTASTKAREAATKKEIKTPTKSSTKSSSTPNSTELTEKPPPSTSMAFPRLPVNEPSDMSPSPQKRRQSAGPVDFTFRAGEHTIVFAPSPNRPVGTSTQRPSTIRHVSSDLSAPPPPPVVGSKKRKFDFENTTSTQSDPSCAHSKANKENTSPTDSDDGFSAQRPAKRVKPSVPTPKKPSAPVVSTTVPNPPALTKPKTRLPTLGVKPKKTAHSSTSSSTLSKPVKKPTTSKISQARLAALSQPKRRPAS